MSMRDTTQADFDLEKMFEMLDEALTSRDERVQSALRGLLTIIELTRPQDDGLMAVETKHGPLRQMQQDLRDVIRRLNNLQEEVRQIKQSPYAPNQPYSPNPGANGPWPYGPYTNPGAGNPWGIDPNMPYTTNKASSSSSYIPPGPYGSLTDNEKDSTINIKLTK